ncbi:hypothetical protein RB213_011144 [Colletotrichum asianum]
MQNVSQSDPIHGGFDNSSPSGGIPSAVTVTLAAGSAPGSILGGYSDPAQAIASPGPLGSPSVVTLWPTAQTDAAAPAAPTVAATAGSGLPPTLDSGFQNPAGAAPVTVTLTWRSEHQLLHDDPRTATRADGSQLRRTQLQRDQLFSAHKHPA